MTLSGYCVQSINAEVLIEGADYCESIVHNETGSLLGARKVLSPP
jgi:hypothetical protein